MSKALSKNILFQFGLTFSRSPPSLLSINAIFCKSRGLEIMVHSQRRNEFVSAPFPLAVEARWNGARRKTDEITPICRWWRHDGTAMKTKRASSFNCRRRESDAIAASDWVDNLDDFGKSSAVSAFRLSLHGFFIDFFCTENERRRFCVDKPAGCLPGCAIVMETRRDVVLFCSNGSQGLEKIYDFHHPCPVPISAAQSITANKILLLQLTKRQKANKSRHRTRWHFRAAIHGSASDFEGVAE